jgi:hypothetical protein
MKQLIKSELIAELQADSNKGIAFNQSGIPLQIMTYREFLNWYSDTGHDTLKVEPVENADEMPFRLVRRLRGGRFVDAQRFDTEEQATDEYYKVMERRYNDDNGGGGIFYPNLQSLFRLQNNKDEWQSLFNEYPYQSGTRHYRFLRPSSIDNYIYVEFQDDPGNEHQVFDSDNIINESIDG